MAGSARRAAWMGESSRQRWTAAVRPLLPGSEHGRRTPAGARGGGWSCVRSHLRGDDLTCRHDDHGMRPVSPGTIRRRRASSAAARRRVGASEPAARAARRDNCCWRAAHAGTLQRVQHASRAHGAEAAGLYGRDDHRLRPEGSGLVGHRCVSLGQTVMLSLPRCDDAAHGAPASRGVERTTWGWRAAVRAT